MLGKTTINAGKRNKLGMINILNYHIHPTYISVTTPVDRSGGVRDDVEPFP